MTHHSLPVVTDQDTALDVSEFQQGDVFGPTEARGFDVKDVDGSSMQTQAIEDRGPDIFVQKEAYDHAVLDSRLLRAASRRANISGSL
jgi:hypothetical protein